MNIEFWFEFASTYSYPAAMRIEQAAAARGIAVQWRSFLLGPIFASQGWKDSPFNLYPAKGRYMWRDMERICAKGGWPLRKPAVFPRNGILAARIACRNADAPWLPTFVRAVYQANFARDLEISNEAVIVDCLQSAGVDGAAVIADAQTQACKDAFRLQTDAAIRRGIFGAPSFVVGDELFWGNDRLEEALQWK